MKSEVEVGGVCWEVGGVHCQIGGVCRRLVESTVKSVEFIFSFVESARPNRLPQATPTSKQTPPTVTSDCTNLHQLPNRLPQDPPNRLHQLHPRLHQAPPQTPPETPPTSTNLTPIFQTTAPHTNKSAVLHQVGGSIFFYSTKLEELGGDII